MSRQQINKMTCAPSRDTDQPGISVTSLFYLEYILYVHSIKRSLYRFLLTRLDYCICDWSADYDYIFTF